MNTLVHISEEQADEFALGTLDRDTAAFVALHAADCGECRARVAESERVATALALVAPRHTTPPKLRRRVFRAAGILRPGPLRWAAGLLTAGAGVAAIIVAAAAFTGMVSVRGQVNDLKAENLALQSRIDEALSQKVEIAALTRELQDQQRISADLRIAAQGDRDLLLALLSPDSEVAEVFASNEAATSVGRLVWDAQQKRVWFVASRLEALPPGQTYQLWAFSSGKYLSLGTFSPDSAGFARFDARVPQGLDAYESAVVTIETAPGAEERSGPSVFVTDLSRLRHD